MSYEEYVQTQYWDPLFIRGKLTYELDRKLMEWVNQHKKVQLQKMIDAEVAKLKVEF